ncbi:phospholipid:diacylglycerol acyltransferase KNAG_0D00600 [Huiozyma naganishii CBS 8797]|uniref:Phospholipid:diacylglycerol acyltransferase n=1 Tax=Huiozyma naganishii (strain ATCC MYA-139 / BCRC 22969 / CBS 8797 / KCTC 17520 / NBRC 10181 / NCYC 3082 / Yp74L-3) TaxID=1071383 RepID=J7RXJ8_HUIN7|nr:hypothetical protein KNAG_0D00600 [Kazachstania naganishii CBS 8797]CCK69812.1 hypothetical protein KNAG_0D00600 [Kazachstania naganishii CBS 8797]
MDGSQLQRRRSRRLKRRYRSESGSSFTTGSGNFFSESGGNTDNDSYYSEMEPIMSGDFSHMGSPSPKIRRSRPSMRRRTSLSDRSRGEAAPKKRWSDSRKVVFIFGAFLGLVIPAYFGASHVHSQNKDLFDNLVNFENVRDYVDDWKTVLPQGVSSFFSDLQNVVLPTSSLEKNLQHSFAVGNQLTEEIGAKAKHPVVLVPGVTSTGIESWGVSDVDGCDSSTHFRKRMWGSFYMLRTMVLDKVCWLKHVKLDPKTGLDPPNVRLRAAQGFEASDFFIAGYWIWNKVIENLGAIGYDPDKMVTAAYDWRLAYLDLEVRDRYFTKLKSQIEVLYDLSGEKVVLVGHSMGSQVIFYFLQWVEAKGKLYGNANDGWVDKHIDSFINVAGTLLGAPKCVPALISGEMKDTIQLNTLAMYGLEKFFSRKERLQMLQTWGGIPSMLPKGGDMIWGNASFSPEDAQHNNTDTYGNFIRFERVVSDKFSNLTMDGSLELVNKLSPSWLQERIRDQYTFGYSKTKGELKKNKKHHRHWSNPLEVALPNAPDMKIYCIYGVNNPTERAYVYKESDNRTASTLNLTIDYDSKMPVFFTEGDGTVPIIAQAMCHKWAQGVSPYNPSGMNVTIIEIKHEPQGFDIRGGGKSAEHVDILGSAELNEYILRIASGHGNTVRSRQLTNMTQWVRKLQFPM